MAPEIATSRIFVRNLPVNLTEHDFRTHFAQRHAVTDIKLIAHRRIGYVGYRTLEDAADAVKYFNKTFVRMSRLHVEPAKPANDVSLPPTRPYAMDAGAEAVQSSGRGVETEENPLKRKRPSPPPLENADAKLKEFLAVMQAPSKSKSWKDDDAAIQLANETDAFDQPDVEATTGHSDDEYQSIEKRRKRGSRAAVRREESEELLDPSSRTRKDTAADVNAHGDDTDWLKSRTGGLLGLPQEDQHGPVILSQNHQSSSARDVDNGSSLDKTVSIDARPAAVDEKTTAALDASEAEIRRSKRLFLRNLPFVVTEEALMDAFSRFGGIEEVCSLSS
jgi:multiple RNA-binding domain-containing protein 1